MPSSSTNTSYFNDGAVLFRQRLVVSLLSNRTVCIRNIRSSNLTAPGLQTREISFLRLLDQITNGTRLEINSAGTQVRFQPGILTGGTVEHDCHNQVSAGWLLQGLLPLAMFGRQALHVQLLNCITDGTEHQDPSADYFQSQLPFLVSQFGVGAAAADDFMADAPPSITIKQRGGAPAGGGRVDFFCPIVKELLSIDVTDPGLIKRVRGKVVTTKMVSSSNAARTAYAAKGVLHRLLPDVWIHTDTHTVKHHRCGPSPALKVLLTAQSTVPHVQLSAETVWNMEGTDKEAPDAVGQRAACQLLEQVRQGGCIDADFQATVLLLMCLTPQDVSRVRIGSLTPYTIGSLRLYKELLGVEFKVKADAESQTVLLSCLGVGYQNTAKAST